MFCDLNELEGSKPKGPAGPNIDKLMVAVSDAKLANCSFSAELDPCMEAKGQDSIPYLVSGTTPLFPWNRLNAESKFDSSSKIGPWAPPAQVEPVPAPETKEKSVGLTIFLRKGHILTSLSTQVVFRDSAMVGEIEKSD